MPPSPSCCTPDAGSLAWHTAPARPQATSQHDGLWATAAAALATCTHANGPSRLLQGECRVWVPGPVSIGGLGTCILMSNSLRRWAPSSLKWNNSWEFVALIYLFLSSSSVIQNILLHLLSSYISIIPGHVVNESERGLVT